MAEGSSQSAKKYVEFLEFVMRSFSKKQSHALAFYGDNVKPKERLFFKSDKRI